LLNAWKRTWTSEIEWVAVAVVPPITLAFVEGMDSTQGVVRGKGAQQVPPLRFAPVGMTKLRVVAHLGMVGGGWTESKKG
jgi:hypothetical protein